MSKKSPPIHLKELDKIFEALCTSGDFGSVALTSHVQERMRQRGINLAEIYNVLQKGRAKELPPQDYQTPDWRWQKIYKGITVIFKIILKSSPPTIVLITCWKGNKPAGETL